MISVTEVNAAVESDKVIIERIETRLDGSIKLLDEAKRIDVMIDYAIKPRIVALLKHMYLAGGWDLSYNIGGRYNETNYSISLEPLVLRG